MVNKNINFGTWEQPPMEMIVADPDAPVKPNRTVRRMLLVAVLILLALTLGLHAQEYLLTRDEATAIAFVKALDERCGYPNPATRTLTSVSINVSTNRAGTTNYTVIVPSVYAPVLRTYIAARIVLPVNRQSDTAITNETRVTTELTAVRTNLLAEPKTGVLREQNFVLVSATVRERETATSEDPISER